MTPEQFKGVLDLLLSLVLMFWALYGLSSKVRTKTKKLFSTFLGWFEPPSNGEKKY